MNTLLPDKMKIQAIVAAALALFCTGGCRQTERTTGQEPTADSLQAARPGFLYGHLGEGTGMSCLELITEDGDTLELNKADERTGTYGLVLGCVTNYTDRYAVETDDSLTFVRLAVNLSQLASEWACHQLPGYLLCLHADGRASTKGEGIPPYSAWTLDGNRLLLHRSLSVSEPRMVATATDTAEILSLCTDSIQLCFKAQDCTTLYRPVNLE